MAYEATRVEFDPPSLRLINEDKSQDGDSQRGSNSTLLHCGDSAQSSQLKVCGNEGRIRPSFIAATAGPHGGRSTCTTRVEFDPPSLRHPRGDALRSLAAATRVEFDPPSLRHMARSDPTRPGVHNEGRIRPSFIAANSWTRGRQGAAQQRGSNSTLLHCGADPEDLTGHVERQRGSNSTLLHCGTRRTRRAERLAVNEGRIRPSFIAACLRERGGRSASDQRGSNSTLLHCGQFNRNRNILTTRQRGSNSTLLHCGAYPAALSPGRTGQRGSNSTLLHCGLDRCVDFGDRTFRNEGRIRPSFIAARTERGARCPLRRQRGSNSTLLHCGSSQ